MKFHHTGIVVSEEKFDELLCGDFPDFIENKISKEFIEYEFKRVEEWGCRCYLIEKTEFIVPDNISGNKLMLWAMRQEQEIGIHHIAFEVDSILGFMEKHSDKNWVSKEPVEGICNSLVNFVHPREFGIMIEYMEIRK